MDKPGYVGTGGTDCPSTAPHALPLPCRESPARTYRRWRIGDFRSEIEAGGFPPLGIAHPMFPLFPVWPDSGGIMRNIPFPVSRHSAGNGAA
jgi:hypothetical protein